MTREDIIFILSSATASDSQKKEAEDALAAYAPAEAMSIYKEALERMAAPAEELPFEPTETAAPSNAPTTTLMAQSEAVPTCINLQDASDWPDEEIPLDDIRYYYSEDGVGDALLYNRMNRYRLVYVPTWKKFLVWQGHYWTEDKDNIAHQRVQGVVKQYKRLLPELYEQLKLIPETEKGAYKKQSRKISEVEGRITRLRGLQGVKALCEQVCSVSNPLQVYPDKLDQHPYLLPCTNGTIRLKVGGFGDGRPQDWMHVHCETPFNPALLGLADPCPETNKFLLASMNGDQDLVDFIWRILGYGLIRERLTQKFFIFWGPHGRNGKDTLQKIITKTLGKALSGVVNIEMFLQSNMVKNSSGPSPDVLELKGASIIWGNEAEENQRFSMSKMKRYNGNGAIKARGLQHADFTEFQQTHLLIMCTNELPKAKADDSSFWERFIVVKWELSFVEDPKEDYQRPADKDLDAKLDAEREGVLVRLVQGAMEYLRDGLKIPEKVKSWNEEVRSSFDDVSAFLDECCERERKQKNPDAYVTRVSAKALNTAWALWFAENRDRRHIPSGKTLGLSLDRKEIPKMHSNGTWRLGLCLNSEWERRVDRELERSNGNERNTSTHFHDDF